MDGGDQRTQAEPSGFDQRALELLTSGDLIPATKPGGAHGDEHFGFQLRQSL